VEPYKVGPKIGVPPPEKKIWGKADREYLPNGWIYQKSEKQVINYDPSHVRRKKMVHFGPLTKKF